MSKDRKLIPTSFFLHVLMFYKFLFRSNFVASWLLKTRPCWPPNQALRVALSVSRKVSPQQRPWCDWKKMGPTHWIRHPKKETWETWETWRNFSLNGFAGCWNFFISNFDPWWSIKGDGREVIRCSRKVWTQSGNVPRSCSLSDSCDSYCCCCPGQSGCWLLVARWFSPNRSAYGDCLLKDPTFNMWLRVSVLAWLWPDLQLAHLFARVFLLWALVDTAGLKHKIRWGVGQTCFHDLQ